MPHCFVIICILCPYSGLWFRATLPVAQDVCLVIMSLTRKTTFLAFTLFILNNCVTWIWIRSWRKWKRRRKRKTECEWDESNQRLYSVNRAFHVHFIVHPFGYGVSPYIFRGLVKTTTMFCIILFIPFVRIFLLLLFILFESSAIYRWMR